MFEPGDEMSADRTYWVETGNGHVFVNFLRIFFKHGQPAFEDLGMCLGLCFKTLLHLLSVYLMTFLLFQNAWTLFHGSPGTPKHWASVSLSPWQEWWHRHGTGCMAVGAPMAVWCLCRQSIFAPPNTGVSITIKYKTPLWYPIRYSKLNN